MYDGTTVPCFNSPLQKLLKSRPFVCKKYGSTIEEFQLRTGSQRRSAVTIMQVRAGRDVNWILGHYRIEIL